MRNIKNNGILFLTLIIIGTGCGAKKSSQSIVPSTLLNPSSGSSSSTASNSSSANSSLILSSNTTTSTSTTTTTQTGLGSCTTPMSGYLTLRAPVGGKIEANTTAIFDLQVSGCTGVYRVTGFNQKFSQSAVITKKYFVPGILTESITIEALDNNDNVVLSKLVSSASFEVVAATTTIVIPSPTPTSTPNVPVITVTLPSHRIIPFSQYVDYCTPPAGYLQGRLNLYNPSAESVSVEISGFLDYVPSAGVKKTDSEVMNLVIPPGESKTYVVRNSLAGYGCHGTSFFYGKIKLPYAQNIVVSGNFLTSMPQGTGVQYTSVPFSISNQGIPAAALSTATRKVGFSQDFTYCSPQIMYMQAYVMLYNPNDTAINATLKGSLSYYSAAGVQEVEAFEYPVSLAANSTYYNGAYNKKAGYGCHGSATISGTVTVQNSPLYLQASGNILTSQATTTNNWQFMNIPFSVFGSMPF